MKIKLNKMSQTRIYISHTFRFIINLTQPKLKRKLNWRTQNWSWLFDGAGIFASLHSVCNYTGCPRRNDQYSGRL